MEDMTFDMVLRFASPSELREMVRTLTRERERLRGTLGRILENEASDRKFAEEFGGYVLDDELREEARAALAKVKETNHTLDSERDRDRALIRELMEALDYYLSNGDIGNTIDIARAALAKAEEVLG